jgi:hypothetical protein
MGLANRPAASRIFRFSSTSSAEEAEGEEEEEEEEVEEELRDEVLDRVSCMRWAMYRPPWEWLRRGADPGGGRFK